MVEAIETQTTFMMHRSQLHRYSPFALIIPTLEFCAKKQLCQFIVHNRAVEFGFKAFGLILHLLRKRAVNVKAKTNATMPRAIVAPKNWIGPIGGEAK
ncbi:hypothetical protein CQ13_29465 [Bradyrhizobium retamae]|uniref:Uncharacterized protein n=1 Tax=Bradyrhizobium retamae TaxID=1300035 RepID=A0A0R3MW25_9BRAD|nr:hypothetical protein CQ13_29465 [Bradyrhizobium retamae]